jgi:hypothetical protein
MLPVVYHFILSQEYPANKFSKIFLLKTDQINSPNYYVSANRVTGLLVPSRILHTDGSCNDLFLHEEKKKQSALLRQEAHQEDQELPKVKNSYYLTNQAHLELLTLLVPLPPALPARSRALITILDMMSDVVETDLPPIEEEQGEFENN